jgi:vacuolar-type H+-ATPase subunit H
MKEVVDKILKEEEQARKRIENARQEGQDIILKSQKESQGIIEQDIAQLNDSIEKKRQDLQKEFIAEKEKIIKETQEQVSAKREVKNKDIPEIAQRIFSRIIAID